MSTPRYEHSDASSKAGWIALALIAGSLVLTLGLVALLLIAFKGAAPQRPAHPGPPPQAPTLETKAGEALAIVHARAARAATTYAWTSPDHQTARIPLDRALQITAQCGWAPSPEEVKP